MKAIIIRAFGGTERLTFENLSVPSPATGEITIDVAFAGVGFVDTLVRSGAFPFVSLPVTPGIEVAGFVREIGAGVTGFSPGQRVAALLTDFTNGGMGGYAAVTRTKAALTVALEEEDDMACAAATIVNGATAFMAMDGMLPGADVVVSGASGGLGQNLIAAAAHAEAASIVAVASNRERTETLQRLGATTVVTPPAFSETALSFDAAFDSVGGPLRLKLLERLRPGGRMILLGNASGEDTALSGDEVWLRSIRVEGLTTGGISPTSPNRVASAARKAIANARRNPPAFAVLDFEQAAQAHQMLEARQGPGKFVLRIRE